MSGLPNKKRTLRDVSNVPQAATSLLQSASSFVPKSGVDLPLELADEDVPKSGGNGQRSCRQRAILTVIESCEVSLWRRHMTHVLGTTRLTSWVRIVRLDW